MQMNFFDSLIDHPEMKAQLIKDQQLSAKCIIAAESTKLRSTKEFLYSVGNFGFLNGQLTEKQRLAVSATLRGVLMAS